MCLEHEPLNFNTIHPSANTFKFQIYNHTGSAWLNFVSAFKLYTYYLYHMCLEHEPLTFKKPIPPSVTLSFTIANTLSLVSAYEPSIYYLYSKYTGGPSMYYMFGRMSDWTASLAFSLPHITFGLFY